MSFNFSDSAPMTVVPPTAPPERNLKLAIVSRYRGNAYYNSTVPEIRFGGKYLEDFRFPIGTRLQVTVKKGRIIITPDKYQPWLPVDVAMEVGEASAMENT